VLPAFERRIQNQLKRAISRGVGGGVQGFDDSDDDDARPRPVRRPRR
jgi:hypothetical protein